MRRLLLPYSQTVYKNHLENCFHFNQAYKVFKQKEKGGIQDSELSISVPRMNPYTKTEV